MIYTPILYFMTYIVAGSAEAFRTSPHIPTAAILLYGFIAASFWSYNGQTPGKRAYNIKVVYKKTQTPPIFILAFLRFLLLLISAGLLFGVVIAFYREDKAMLHDLVCGTVVIEDEKA